MAGSVPRALPAVFANHLKTFLLVFYALLLELVPELPLVLGASDITLVKMVDRGRKCHLRINLPSRQHFLAALSLSGEGSSKTRLRFDEQRHGGCLPGGQDT
jgi:hypothetical protein